MDNAEKAAGLLWLLGEENCRKIASHLGRAETEKLLNVRKPCAGISDLRKLKSYLGRKDNSGWRGTLEKADFREESNPLSFIGDIDSEKLFAVLKDESDLVTAVVLKYAGREKSIPVLEKYPEERRNEILRTMLSTGEAAPRTLEAMAQSLKKKLI